MNVPPNSVLFTPGFAETAARERLVRDAAFLGLTESVAGYELRPMTLRHYLVLRLAGNPLLFSQLPSPAQLAQFLWILLARPEGSPGAVKRRFFKRCRRDFVPPPRPRAFWLYAFLFFLWRQRLPDPLLFGALRMWRWRRRRERALVRGAMIINEVRQYVAEAMMDRPGPAAKGFSPSYYSDVCTWWGELGRQGYVLSREEVLDTPLKILCQCLREIEHEKGRTPSNSASAAKVASHLQTLNEQLRQKAADKREKVQMPSRN